MHGSIASAPHRVGPRERLLAAADVHFYRDGITATGIDRVLRTAKVAKQSLYDHFGGKDGLITAYVERRDQRFMEWFQARLADGPSDPRVRLERVFDIVGELIDGANFCGCAFIAVSEELADPRHPARVVAARSKDGLRGLLINIAAAAGVSDPERAGSVLMLLIDGVLVVARMGRGPEALAAARAAAGVVAAA